MSAVFIKIHNWENPIRVSSSYPLSEGDVVIIESSSGIEAGIVEKCPVSDKENQVAESKDGKPRILRKANLSDLKVLKDHRKKEQEILEMCRREVKKTELPMKVMEASLSFDGGSITFAFIADGRIDFRDLVKSLAKKLQRSIRLHQIGARDESRQCGGYGICGRELCCAKFKGNLPSITSEMAKIQHIAHRGSERISGICGRLMCCLAYEANQYKEMIAEYPAISSIIKTKDGQGIVKDVNILSDEIKVELENKSVIIIKKSEIG
ncbi:MAG: regulatory iron-sulfur-containing complex subunit RicT [Candidatus Moranbacteria bacterium]|nr:regulatory iron-sulfur-containing complex subunit RicT [Candidatus Moranbacteria bacterium]